LQGLQPDLLQRAYARETQNSAMLVRRILTISLLVT
jgi:hypothetical protein